MLPVMGFEAGQAPKSIRPHLIVKLKRGWQYKDAGSVFISSKGQDLSPHKDLPQGSRIVYMLPDLASAAPRSLSADERNLASYVHVILPRGTEASDYLAVVRDWQCVEEAQLPPEISLP